MIRRDVGRWCGTAELGPEATIVSNEGPDAEMAHLGVQRQAELLFGRSVPERRAQRRQRGISDGSGEADAFDLCVVLQDAQFLDQRHGRNEVHTVEPRFGVGAMLVPTDGGALEAEALHPGVADGVGHDLALAVPRDLDTDVETGQLFLRLRAVAPIADEEDLVGQHQQQAGAAGESGEVAQIGEVRDQQGVSAGDADGERCSEPDESVAVVHRRQRFSQRGHENSPAIASTAST